MQNAAWGSGDIAKPFPFALESHLCHHMMHQLYFFGPFSTFVLYSSFLLAFSIHGKVESKQRKRPRNKVLTRAARSFNYN